VAALLADRAPSGPEPYLRSAQAAADYLGCPVSRVYALTSQRRLPHEKDGSLLLFRASALDDYVANGGAVRA